MVSLEHETYPTKKRRRRRRLVGSLTPATRLYGCLVLVCLWTILQWCLFDPGMILLSSCPLDERDICFVTSIFGDSIDQVDRPANVKGFLRRWCNVQFWLATNLPDLPAPGWTTFTMTTPPNHSHIVQSRETKFLGWKVLQPQVQQCSVVIYLDGYLQPKPFTLRKFRRIAQQVQESYWGLSQVRQKHFNGLSMTTILRNLIRDGKDTSEHVQTTLDWFQQQPDHQEIITYYLNKYFGTFTTASFCVILLSVLSLYGSLMHLIGSSSLLCC